MGKFNFRKPLIVLDLEMSGPDPTLHQIVEIAAIKCDPKNLGQIEVFHKFCRSADTKTPEQVMQEAHPVAISKVGFSEESLAFGPTPEEVVNEFKKWLPSNYIFVGFNLMLDFMFLRTACVPEVAFTYRFLDITTLIELYFGQEGSVDTRKGYSLVKTAHSLGIPTNNSHSALADAEITLEILKKLLKVL